MVREGYGEAEVCSVELRPCGINLQKFSCTLLSPDRWGQRQTRCGVGGVYGVDGVDGGAQLPRVEVRFESGVLSWSNGREFPLHKARME